MNKIIIGLLTVILITGCENRTSHTSKLANGYSIQKMINDAENGVVSANDSASTLLGLSLSSNKDYNKLKIDSLDLPSGKYFTILLQYSNPVKNKFGIYNDSLKTLLLDKSLYGNLAEEIITIGNDKLIKLNETFRVKDTLELNRLSLYKIENDSANLAFRTFVRLKEDGAEYTQVIKDFSDNQIVTKINGTNVGSNSDIFKFDSTSGSYKSGQDFFNDFVKREINNLLHN
jgi:hypothetical protein